MIEYPRVIAVSIPLPPEEITKELGYQLGRRFSTAVVLFHSAVADQLGLNVTDWKCASILLQEGPCNPSRLAELTGMSSAATTQVLDRLERAGIVRRERDPGDRRRVILHPVLSPALAQRLQRIFAGLGEAMAGVMSGYDYKQLATILDFVKRTSEVLEGEARKLRGGE